MSKLDDEMQHVQLVLNKRLEQCALKEESLSDLRRRQAQLESQSTVVDDALLEKIAAIEALEIQLLSAGVSVPELDEVEDRPSKPMPLQALWRNTGRMAAAFPTMLSNARTALRSKSGKESKEPQLG
ncbi:hypothetical protein ACKKBG_A01925 [Auxenochlorella protothecoides x Auxenochlorella symbiontica]